MKALQYNIDFPALLYKAVSVIPPDNQMKIKFFIRAAGRVYFAWESERVH